MRQPFSRSRAASFWTRSGPRQSCRYRTETFDYVPPPWQSLTSGVVRPCLIRVDRAQQQALACSSPKAVAELEQSHHQLWVLLVVRPCSTWFLAPHPSWWGQATRAREGNLTDAVELFWRCVALDRRVFAPPLSVRNAMAVAVWRAVQLDQLLLPAPRGCVRLLQPRR